MLKLMRSDFPEKLHDGHRVCDIHFEGQYIPGSIPKISAGRKIQKARRRLNRVAVENPSPLSNSTSDEVSVSF